MSIQAMCSKMRITHVYHAEQSYRMNAERLEWRVSALRCAAIHVAVQSPTRPLGSQPVLSFGGHVSG